MARHFVLLLLCALCAPLQASLCGDDLATLGGAGPARFSLAQHQSLRGWIARSETGGREILDLLDRFPYLAKLYRGDAGVAERLSVREHTMLVYAMFTSQAPFHDVKGIKLSDGRDAFTALKFAVALHDIGKPIAVAVGNKELQHLVTAPILEHVMAKFGFSPAEIRFARELIAGDPLGIFIRSWSVSPEMAYRWVEESAKRAGLPTADYFKLLKLFYTVDAASYPFVRIDAFHEAGADGDGVWGKLWKGALSVPLGVAEEARAGLGFFIPKFKQDPAQLQKIKVKLVPKSAKFRDLEALVTAGLPAKPPLPPAAIPVTDPLKRPPDFKALATTPVKLYTRVADRFPESSVFVNVNVGDGLSAVHLGRGIRSRLTAAGFGIPAGLTKVDVPAYTPGARQLVRFEVRPWAKVVDVTQGEGKAAFERFRKSYRGWANWLVEDFAKAAGADVVVLPVAGGKTVAFFLNPDALGQAKFVNEDPLKSLILQWERMPENPPKPREPMGFVTYTDD